MKTNHVFKIVLLTIWLTGCIVPYYSSSDNWNKRIWANSSVGAQEAFNDWLRWKSLKNLDDPNKRKNTDEKVANSIETTEKITYRIAICNSSAIESCVIYIDSFANGIPMNPKSRTIFDLEKGFHRIKVLREKDNQGFSTEEINLDFEQTIELEKQLTSGCLIEIKCSK